MLSICMTRTGGPDVLEARDVPMPELPTPHHVRVRLRAAGVNPIDTKLRKNGTYYPDRLPTVLGCDGAGVVETVGNAVTRFRAGDEVYFFHGGIGNEPGNYAQYNVVHEDYLARKPKHLSFAEAAAVPLALITAWEALHDRARLQAGEQVLIHAAAGGVGHVAVQLAKHRGARVAATVSGADKTAFVKSLGADRIIDYKAEDFVPAVLDWTGNRGVDTTFDTVGGDTFCRSFAATKVYGNVVTLLQTACDADAVKHARLRNQSIHYELMLTPLYLGLHAARVAQRHILEEGANLIEQGRLKVHVRRELALAQAAEAHRLLEAGHTTGKIVLRIE
ncbi:MAG: zinc-dependent alcohol dehydrogenase family protein [Gammaproteobacteria bacterium]|nr:zinc-dependent alcohol dehydrogenase family protein [Gammaproteobacteria bacterium]